MHNRYKYMLLIGLIFSTNAMTSTPSVNITPPNYRHTPYVGLGFGGNNSYHDTRIVVPGSTINKFDMSDQSFMGELIAGWLFRLPDRWQIGLETNYSVTSNEPHSLINGNMGTGTKVKVNSDWAWGGGVRLGYMLSKVSTFYLKAGFEYRQFHTKLSPTPVSAPVINSKSSKVAFTPAMGFEVNVAQRWAVGGEFRSARFGNINTSSDDKRYSATVKPRIDTYMINLKYKFWTNDTQAVKK